MTLSCVIDKDPPHEGGGYAKEVGAVLPLNALLIYQP